MKRTGLFCIAIMLLAGCASPPPPIHQYLLRGDPVEAQGQINIRIRAGLGRVVLAPYLMGNTGIRIETESGQIQPAGRHQWAEPLDSGLRWFLREKIASELGNEVGGGLTDVQDWDYRIDLFVARMHGTMDGRAILDATFIVRSMNSSAASSQYRFSKSLPLPQEGYAGVVDAQRELAQELGVMIAGALQERIEAADEAEATSSAGG